MLEEDEIMSYKIHDKLLYDRIMVAKVGRYIFLQHDIYEKNH